jgi:hypothetical protein
MPVLHDFILSLGAGMMQHRPSAAFSGRRKEEIDHLRESLIDETNQSLLEPKATYEVYDVYEIRSGSIILANYVPLTGPLLSQVWPTATSIIAAVGTIGPRLEERVAQYFALGDPLKAYLLDDIGSLAVDRLSTVFCQRLPYEGASSPLSPGLEGWPVSDQALLYELSGAHRIGINLTEGDMLVPRKSVSLAIALGPGMPRWTPEDACARCSLRSACQYRKAPRKRLPHG